MLANAVKRWVMHNRHNVGVTSGCILTYSVPVGVVGWVSDAVTDLYPTCGCGAARYPPGAQSCCACGGLRRVSSGVMLAMAPSGYPSLRASHSALPRTSTLWRRDEPGNQMAGRLCRPGRYPQLLPGGAEALRHPAGL